MICRRCGHALEWTEDPQGEMVLWVIDSHLVIDRPSCAPWWNHEAFDLAVVARSIVRAIDESRPRT